MKVRKGSADSDELADSRNYSESSASSVEDRKTANFQANTPGNIRV